MNDRAIEAFGLLIMFIFIAVPTVALVPPEDRWLPAILAVCGAYYIAKSGMRGE